MKREREVYMAKNIANSSYRCCKIGTPVPRGYYPTGCIFELLPNEYINSIGQVETITE